MSQPFEKDVTIIMLSWNDAEYLHDWFDSYQKYKPKDLSVEIFVCENGSNDPEFDIVAKKYAHVEGVRFDKIKGHEYIAAMNPYMQKAKGEYIMLSAPGAPFMSDVLSELRKYLLENKEAGAASAKYYNDDGTFQNVYKPPLNFSNTFLYNSLIGKWILKSTPRFLWRNTTITRGREPNEPFRIGKTHLCAFMLKREAIDGYDLIDDNMPLGPVDADLITRVYKLGYTVMGVPEAKTRHFRSVAVRHHDKEKITNFVTKGMLVYFARYYPIRFPLLKWLFVNDRRLQRIAVKWDKALSEEEKIIQIDKLTAIVNDLRTINFHVKNSKHV